MSTDEGARMRALRNTEFTNGVSIVAVRRSTSVLLLSVIKDCKEYLVILYCFNIRRLTEHFKARQIL